MKLSPFLSKAALLALPWLMVHCSAGQDSVHPEKSPAQAQQPIAKNPDAITETNATTKVTNNLASFVPGGYSILDTAGGDLNLDPYPDMIMVLKNNHEDSVSESPRPLLILAGFPDHSYQLAARNDSVVLCHDCGGVFGDPYEHTTVKNGYFSIEHYGGSSWRWTRVITFKFIKDKHAWFLHRDAGVSYHTSDPDKQEQIISSKEDYDKLPFERFNNLKGK